MITLQEAWAQGLIQEARVQVRLQVQRLPNLSLISKLDLKQAYSLICLEVYPSLHLVPSFYYFDLIQAQSQSQATLAKLRQQHRVEFSEQLQKLAQSLVFLEVKKPSRCLPLQLWFPLQA